MTDARIPDARDRELFESTHNTARYFVENRPVAWLLLVLSVVLGVAGYLAMPEQKSPTIPVRVALAMTPYPGADAHQVDLLVTRAVEKTIAQNATLHPPTPNNFGLRSLSLPGISVVQINLDEKVSDTEQEFSDIHLRLDDLNAQLPEGAGPVQFTSGVGETSALMLTIASPLEREPALALRAHGVEQTLRRVRSAADGDPGDRATVLMMFPREARIQALESAARDLGEALEARGLGSDARLVQGPGFLGMDVRLRSEEPALLDFAERWLRGSLGVHGFHPDVWDPVLIRGLDSIPKQLSEVAGPRITLHELGQIADFLTRGLEGVPQVSKVITSGVVPERVYLLYSQNRLAELGIPLRTIPAQLRAENVVAAGGSLVVERGQVPVAVSGTFSSTREIGEVVIGRTGAGAPVYLRTLGELHRGYQSPPAFLNSYTRRAPDGSWLQTPAVTLAVQMRPGEQIADFGRAVDAALADLSQRLPEDLVIARTSDQPRQVKESVGLFMEALYEAIALVVLISLVGFRDWRASVLLMISIPLTLALTFSAAFLLGIQIQQVSIAALIIALGLLVDDPVVASDAIKRSLASGNPRGVAAWLGPTRLARAILFATITNVVAYLPFVLLTGNTGDFLYSLPIMMAAALIASRIVSMTFVPLLGEVLLRAPDHAEPSMEERRSRGFTGWYYRMGKAALRHRFAVLGGVTALMLAGFALASQLRVSFFPVDVQYLATVDLWLPVSSSVPDTAASADHAEAVIRKAAGEAQEQGVTEAGLVSITRFAGGGSPRFWATLTPQPPQQPNYAQLVLEIEDKDDMPRLAPFLQRSLSAEVPGAWIDVKQLQTNPVEYPIEVRLAGRASADSTDEQNELRALRRLADELVGILQSAPTVRIRHDWYDERFTLEVAVDPDRASVAGVSDVDVAHTSQAALDGLAISHFEEGNLSIPIVAVLRPDERPRLSAFGDLIVYAAETGASVPLSSIADTSLRFDTERIRRRDHFRTITVYGYPREGALASEVMNEVASQLDAFERRLPPGIHMEIGGEIAKARHGFRDLLRVLLISASGIFIALVFQFRSTVKSLIVLAGVPFGFAGGLVALVVMGASFSFMAFLGLVALVGVIVSHVIVLFDFIEERHEMGESLEESLLDAGIMRLRPVLITVAATVLALFPLAIHGGPLWQPLCYAQIGGLTVATAISLLIVPVIYAICVYDLKIVRWEGPTSRDATSS